VVPPLQSGMVGSYLVRGAWFPSHLPLDGTGRIHIFLAVTDDLRYPWYRTATILFVEKNFVLIDFLIKKITY
jgi:hypothetical protein